jgi:hypothetical protein
VEIKTKPQTQAYRDGWDRIFKKPEKPAKRKTKKKK